MDRTRGPRAGPARSSRTALAVVLVAFVAVCGACTPTAPKNAAVPEGPSQAQVGAECGPAPAPTASAKVTLPIERCEAAPTQP